MIRKHNSWSQMMKPLSAVFVLLTAVMGLFLLGTKEAEAQTCPPASNTDLRCKDVNGNCIRCQVRWHPDGVPTPISDPLGGGGCDGCLVAPDNFDEVTIWPELKFGLPTRGKALNVTYPNQLPNQSITTLLVRYYPSSHLVEPLYAASPGLNAVGVFIGEDFGQIPLDAPGGEYRVIACTLEDCSLDTILKNLGTDKIQMNKFELPYLAQFTAGAIVADTQTIVEAPLTIDEQVAPETIGFQLYKDNAVTSTTQDFSQYCSAELRTACAASLNLFYPHIEYDAAKQAVEIYPVGAYLRQESPIWNRYLGASAFVPGTYKLQSIVNGVPEDATTVEVTAP